MNELSGCWVCFGNKGIGGGYGGFPFFFLASFLTLQCVRSLNAMRLARLRLFANFFNAKLRQ